MLQLTPEQYAKLCLPDPGSFLPRLAAEVRRDHPAAVSSRDDAQLLADVQTSYRHAVNAFGMTHLPTLVAGSRLTSPGREDCVISPLPRYGSHRPTPPT